MFCTGKTARRGLRASLATAKLDMWLMRYAEAGSCGENCDDNF